MNNTRPTVPGNFDRVDTNDPWASVPRQPITVMVDTIEAFIAAAAIDGGGRELIEALEYGPVAWEAECLLT